jgi:4-amino-4-deoxy-L-arabinose transferase-like glycosyltransferase
VLLVASDLTLASLNFEAMTEPLFVLLATAGVLLWMRGEFPRSEIEGGRGLRKSAWAGVLLGLATLTRPAGLYLPLLLALITLCRPTRRRVVEATVLVLAAYGCVAPWVVRNAYAFGVPRLTTVDTINMVYFVGAGAYQIEYSLDRVAAQRRIAAEYALPTPEQAYNHWTTDQSVAEIDTKLRRAARPVLLAHPRALMIASAIGVAKANIGHSTGSMARIMGLSWSAPHLSRLAEGRFSEALASMLANPLPVASMFVWQVLLTAMVGLAAIAAALRLLFSRQYRTVAVILLIIVGYHLLTIAFVGLDAYARQRVGATPFLAVLASSGVMWALDSIRGNRLRHF